MYEYKYVRINLINGLFSTKPQKDYKEVIETNAKNGWRFVQIFALAINGYGKASHYDLIFEKEKN